ncbi:hypothetical protein Poli38472_001075 [Pythium oligandrum]|uniref:Microsomal glutathione S-transferase 1 n=1 Tax=Pythium oligandrum TaxID=41045 RepID=A0A8K1CSU0_PYTOL|nr:hypothetical protein Poli38472_001075 [Pythium oligandrum]|eukprot:TMW68919.1 hypothetical protein Poli38472_001075 [Pythium oligandrum]
MRFDQHSGLMMPFNDHYSSKSSTSGQSESSLDNCVPQLIFQFERQSSSPEQQVTMVLGPTSVATQAFAVSTGVLYLKFAISGIIQGLKTDKLRADLKTLNGTTYGSDKNAQETQNLVLAKQHEEEERWRRIVSNDVESLPFAFFIFSAGLFTEANEKVQLHAIAVYTVARFVHTHVVAKGRTTARDFIWSVGAVAMLVASGNAIVATFS